MAYRIVGRAEYRIEAVLLESARRWGIDAAVRYNRLITAAMTAIGDSPPYFSTHTLYIRGS
jgi:hypothetical protein